MTGRAGAAAIGAWLPLVLYVCVTPPTANAPFSALARMVVLAAMPALRANVPSPSQRPCSTQKTGTGTCRLPGGTRVSLPMHRSCWPPSTTSPAIT